MDDGRGIKHEIKCIWNPDRTLDFETCARIRQVADRAIDRHPVTLECDLRTLENAGTCCFSALLNWFFQHLSCPDKGSDIDDSQWLSKKTFPQHHHHLNLKNWVGSVWRLPSPGCRERSRKCLRPRGLPSPTRCGAGAASRQGKSLAVFFRAGLPGRRFLSPHVPLRAPLSGVAQSLIGSRAWSAFPIMTRGARTPEPRLPAP